MGIEEDREKLIRAVEHVSALRRELRDAEAHLDAIMTGASATKRAPKGTTISGSLPSKILGRMSIEPGKGFTADDFSDLVQGANGMQYVRSSLYRLVKAKKLKRAGRGRFKVKVSNGAESTGEEATH